MRYIDSSPVLGAAIVYFLIMESPEPGTLSAHCYTTPVSGQQFYSVAVSAQGYQSVIECLFYHRELSGVLRDAHTWNPPWSRSSVKT